MTSIGNLYATLGVDTSSMAKSRQQMKAFTNSAETNMGRAHKSTSVLSKAFLGLGIAMSGALVVRKMVQFGTEGVKSFGDLSQSIAKASTLFGDVVVDMENLKSKMRELSNDSGLAASAVGEGLYNALSAGIQATGDMGTSMEFMRKSTMLAKAGFTDMETASSATIKTLNSYNLGLEHTDRIQKILIQTQNKGIVVVDELGKYLARVTPVAAQFGVSFENVGAAIATLTAQGLPARIAISQVGAMLLEMGKAGTDGADALNRASRAAGWSTGNFTELMESGKTLGDVLNAMRQYADDTNTTLLDLFSSADAGKAAASMTGESAQRMSEAFNSMATDADVLGESYEKVMNTLSTKTQILQNKVVNLKGQIGEVLAPAIITIVDQFDTWVSKNQELIEQKMEEWASNLADAVNWVVENMDKLVFLVKGLIGYKIATWLATATTGMHLFAAASWIAVTAVKALGRALLVGFIIEGISLAIDAIQEMNKIVRDSPMVWKDMVLVSMDFFVNGIISTVVSLGNLMTNLMHLITDPIVYGLAQVFSFDTIKSIMSGNFTKAFSDIGKASADALAAAWAKIPEDFNDTMSTRTFRIASDKQMSDFWNAYNGPAPINPIVPPGGWQTGGDGGSIVPGLPGDDDGGGDGFGDLESVAKSHMTSMTTMYKGFQDDLTLMDFEGWEKRKQAVVLWGENMEEELRAAEVWNDEFKTLVENIMDVQNKIILAEESVADGLATDKQKEAMNGLAKTVDDLRGSIGAMAQGPEAFEAFQEAARVATEVANVKKAMEELGVSAEWMEKNLPNYERWLELHKEAQTEMERLAEISQNIEQISTQAFDSMFRGLMDNLLDGENAFKDFGDLALRIISDIAYQMLMLSVINPAASAFGDALSGMFKKSEHGNVFDTTGFVPFKRGGIVDQPTIFPFAKGTGLMGEAGPEAIMPLTRIGGNLGVMAIGNEQQNGDVIINVINNGAPVEKESQKQSRGPNGENIIDVVVKTALDRLDSKGSLDGMFQKHGARRGGTR